VKNDVGWKREFFTFEFATAPNPGPRTAAMGLPVASRSTGPDDKVLRAIYDELPPLLPKVVE
jgi:hypothetical protein